jgi:hypothetical protein
LNHINGPTPGGFLAVIDFTQIEHMALNDPIARHPPVLNDAPVTVFFAVFESLFGPQEHTDSVGRKTSGINRVGRHYRPISPAASR